MSQVSCAPNWSRAAAAALTRHAALLVDAVALGLEQGALDGGVGAVEPPAGGDDPPPRQVRRRPEHVGHGLGAPRAAQLLGQLAVGHQLAGPEGGHGVDHGPLEGARLVVPGPGGGVRRGRAGHGGDGTGPGTVRRR